MKRIEAIINFTQKAITITDKVVSQDILDHPAYEVVKEFVPGAKAILEIGSWFQEYQDSKAIPQQAIALVCREAGISEEDSASIKSPKHLNEVLAERGINNPERLFEREVNRLFSQAKYPELTRHLVAQNESQLRYIEQQFEALQRLLQDGFYHLFPIEKVLDALPQTNHAREPCFFRTGGPLAVDFEYGYVHRRPEVDQLRERLTVESTMLLSGAGASGKSVIVRQVAYELWREGWSVYLISLTQPVKRPKLQQELERLGEGEHLVVIEDVHLNPTLINELLQIAGSNWPKLLLTSRPIDFDSVLRKEFNANQFERLPRLDLKPLDATVPIICLYAEKQGIELTPDLNDSLTEITGGSLWILAYALKAVKDTGAVVVERELVLKEVERDLQKLWYDHDDIRYPKVLIALSVLYRKEVPTDANYLEQAIPGARDILSRLSRLGEANEIDFQGRLYGLPHSALADLYFEFTSRSAWEDPLYSDTCSFLRDYLTSDRTQNGLAAIRSKEAYQMIACLQIHDIAKLARSMEVTENPGEASRAIMTIQRTDPSKGKALVAELDLSRFAQRIDAAEDPWEAAQAIKVIQEIDPSKGQALWAVLDLSRFAQGIEAAENLWNAALAIKILQEIDPSKGQALVAELDLSSFAQRIEAAENSGDAARAIEAIQEIDPSKGQALVTELDLSCFAQRIEATEDLVDAAWVIMIIREIDPSKGQALLAALDFSRFAQRIETADNLENAALVLGAIQEIDPSKGQALWAALDLSCFAQRIEVAENLWEAAQAIKILQEIDPSKGQALWAALDLSRFAQRIEAAENLGLAARVIEAIQEIEPSRGQALVAELDLSHFAQHIEAAEDPWEAAQAIKAIQVTAPSKGQALVAKLDLSRFAQRIEVAENLWEAARAIEAIQEIEPSRGQALVAELDLSRFAQRIEVAEDLWNSAGAITTLQKFDPSKGLALVAELDLSRFAQRIVTFKNPWPAAWAIEAIQEIDPSKGQALVAELDLSCFAQCIEEAENPGDAARAITIIQKTDPSKGQALLAALDLSRFAQRIEAADPGDAAKAITTIQKTDPSKGLALVAELDSEYIQGLVDLFASSDKSSKEKDEVLTLISDQHTSR